jgi:phage terminase large subunit-like protein
LTTLVDGVQVVCLGCGTEFVAPDRRRLYCFECSPAGKWLGVQQSKLRVVPDSAGEPFTVAHFRVWAERLKLKDGTLFELEPFQALFLEDLFARDANGVPVFEELWLVIPEGNGKTTFMGLVALYTIEHKPEAWVPVAASARDQAVDLTYRICSGFVQRNGLDAKYGGPFVLHPGYRSIQHDGSLGTMKIFASDAASGDGTDPVGFALIEELHRLPSMDLYETWAGKLEKSDSQLVIVSTAGAPGSPFEELRTRMRQDATDADRNGCFIRATAPGSVLHEYALPEDGDPEDLELVLAANPFSRKTLDSLARKRAKNSWNPSHWRRFTCNLPTRDGVAAITEAEWYAAVVEDEIPEKQPIWLGLDLAFVWDCTALVPLWWRDTGYRLLGPAVILEPPRTGDQLDSHLVEAALLDMHKRNPIHTVVMDPSKAEQLAQWIDETLGCLVVKRAQTNSFACVDYAHFMEALRLGQLHHTGDPGLTKHVLNAESKLLPGGDTKFIRPAESRRSGEQPSRVIDALSAASMVHSEAVMREAFTGEPLVGWG